MIRAVGGTCVRSSRAANGAPLWFGTPQILGRCGRALIRPKTTKKYVELRSYRLSSYFELYRRLKHPFASMTTGIRHTDASLYAASLTEAWKPPQCFHLSNTDLSSVVGAIGGG
jgi:hypothetical protein